MSDAVDTAKTLFQPVGVPWQVVIDHEMGALQVQPFACGIGSDKNAHFLVLPEAFFHLAPFVAQHSAVDGDNGFFAAEKGANFIGQIAQCVAMFGKNDQLFAKAIGIEHALLILQQAGKLFPFAVGATDPYRVRHAL